MNLRRRVISFFTVAAVLLLSFLTVSADSIWMPIDLFFDPETCEFTQRHYIAASDEGEVTLVDTPITMRKIGTFANGIDFLISWVCKGPDDEPWGSFENYTEPDAKEPVYVYGDVRSGYLPMEDLKVVYDTISFTEDHPDDVKDIETFDLNKKSGKIILWAYPGAERIDYTLDIKEIDSDGFWTEDNYQISKIYTDANGNDWVYFEIWPYKYKGWIFVPDMEREEPVSLEKSEK